MDCMEAMIERLNNQNMALHDCLTLLGIRFEITVERKRYSSMLPEFTYYKQDCSDESSRLINRLYMLVDDILERVDGPVTQLLRNTCIQLDKKLNDYIEAISSNNQQSYVDTLKTYCVILTKEMMEHFRLIIKVLKVVGRDFYVAAARVVVLIRQLWNDCDMTKDFMRSKDQEQRENVFSKIVGAITFFEYFHIRLLRSTTELDVINENVENILEGMNTATKVLELSEGISAANINDVRAKVSLAPYLVSSQCRSMIKYLNTF